MSRTDHLKQATVLVLTSTYPRWDRDDTPRFVADFAERLATHVKAIYVIAPHFKNAKRHESSGNLHIMRYRYFFPASGENIAYGGGGVGKIKKTPIYAIKLLSFMAALFFTTLITTLRRHVTVINAHWLIPQGFVAVLVKFLTGRKVVITIHGSDVLSLNGKYMRIVKRFILRYADEVCVNSSVTKSVCEGLYQREYHLIPMGIDFAKWRSGKPSAELKARFAHDRFTILFVGRLSEEKGIIYLLQALVELKKAGTRFQLIVIGSGPLEDKLHDFVEAHGLADDVNMIGWIDSSELPAYYKLADVFAGPSLHEAQGLTFLEALAAGLPVITTDSGGTVDFVKDGVNGLLVPIKSSEALTKALTGLIDDRTQLKKLATKASPSIEAAYSWEHTIDAYSQVFERPTKSSS